MDELMRLVEAAEECNRRNGLCNIPKSSCCSHFQDEHCLMNEIDCDIILAHIKPIVKGKKPFPYDELQILCGRCGYRMVKGFNFNYCPHCGCKINWK